MDEIVDNVVEVKIDDEMKQSYLDYAMSVIVGRALPDVRDGLKPVQRRVVYAMYREGLLSNRRYSKCAGVVGEVLKKYHPHGDSSVYDALVRLAQSWSLRYPLVDGQGNFGSIDGDPPAAYRYTECRMTKLSEQLLSDIDKSTVDFAPNFDDSQQEPVVLPSLLPNLLINGATGIAVGMATHMPPHNLREIVDGCVALIEDPEINTYQLMAHVKGPDFPTGGTICGRSGIFQAFDTGRGSVKVRATIEEEPAKNGIALVVTEIPYMVNKSKLIERIAQLVNEKQIDGIARLRDESDRKGMRIVIELKRDATKEVVQSQLYKLTPLQANFSVINLAIVEGKPVILTLKQILSHFINFRREVVTRSTEFDLKKAQERLHILDGYRIALANLDEVIALIRKSSNAGEAKQNLIDIFSLSSLQATAILELRLQKLTSMERIAIESEFAEITKKIEELTALLADRGLIDALIIDQLKQIKEAYGDERKTGIEDDAEDISLEDLIEDSNAVVTISSKGYIKRTSLDEYRTQHRGGKGVSGTSNREDEFTETLFVASTHTVLIFITSAGRTFCLKVYEVPESGRISRGRALVNLLQLREDETVCTVVTVPEFEEEKFLLVGTKYGLVKKTDLSEFKKIRKGGLNTVGVREGDVVIGAQIVGDKDDMILSMRSGMAIRFSCGDIRATGRGAQGVKGVDLEDGDEVVSITFVPHDDASSEEIGTSEVSEFSEGSEGEELEVSNQEPMLVTICEAGFGKKTPVAKYRIQRRGGKGLIDIRTAGRNGPVVGSFVAQGIGNQLLLVTNSGKLIRLSLEGISAVGRNTMGVKLIDLEEGERVVAVAAFIDEDVAAVVDEEPYNEGKALDSDE